MLEKLVMPKLKTNILGEAKGILTFNGFIEEIKIDFGELEQETEILFETSTGKKFGYKTNNNKDFPVNPRHSINEGRLIETTQPSAQPIRYANTGIFMVTILNAGSKKNIGEISIIIEK